MNFHTIQLVISILFLQNSFQEQCKTTGLDNFGSLFTQQAKDIWDISNEETQINLLYQDQISTLFRFIFSFQKNNQTTYTGIISKLNFDKTQHEIQVFFSSTNLQAISEILGFQKGQLWKKLNCPNIKEKIKEEFSKIIKCDQNVEKIEIQEKNNLIDILLQNEEQKQLKKISETIEEESIEEKQEQIQIEKLQQNSDNETQQESIQEVPKIIIKKNELKQSLQNQDQKNEINQAQKILLNEQQNSLKDILNPQDPDTIQNQQIFQELMQQMQILYDQQQQKQNLEIELQKKQQIAPKQQPNLQIVQKQQIQTIQKQPDDIQSYKNLKSKQQIELEQLFNNPEPIIENQQPLTQQYKKLMQQQSIPLVNQQSQQPSTKITIENQDFYINQILIDKIIPKEIQDALTNQQQIQIVKTQIQQQLEEKQQQEELRNQLMLNRNSLDQNAIPFQLNKNHQKEPGQLVIQPPQPISLISNEYEQKYTSYPIYVDKKKESDRDKDVRFVKGSSYPFNFYQLIQIFNIKKNIQKSFIIQQYLMKILCQFENENLSLKSINRISTGPCFEIYSTDNPKYLIKRYYDDNDNNEIIQQMIEQFVKVNDNLLPTTGKILKASRIQNQQENLQNNDDDINNTIITDNLIVFSSDFKFDFKSLTKTHFFSTYYDVYHFIYQFCQQLKLLEQKNINGFIYQSNQVILNKNKNFQMYHFDIKVKEETKNLIEGNEDHLCPAPEYQNGIYDQQSNIWDLGILIYQIFQNQELPEVNYQQQNISNLNLKIEDELINNIFKQCLKFNPNERISTDEIIQQVSQRMFQIQEFYIFSNEKDTDKEIFNLDIRIQDTEFSNFKKNNIDNKEHTIIKIVEQMLNQDNVIDNNILEDLSLKANKDKKIHFQFFTTLKQNLQRDIKNPVIAMKGLLLLYGYLNKSNRKSIVIYTGNKSHVKEIKNDDSKVMENIQESSIQNDNNIIIQILNLYKGTQYQNSIINEFCELLQRRCYLLMKYIKYFECNFSFSKIYFYQKWENYLNAEMIKDFFEYLGFLVAMFLKYKNCQFQYFEKNVFFAIGKDYYKMLSLLVNILIFFQYCLVYTHQNDNEKNQQIINEGTQLVKKYFKILENHRTIFDVYTYNENNLCFLKKFLIKKDLLSEQENYMKLMESSDIIKFSFNAQKFMLNFFSTILQLPYHRQKINKKLFKIKEKQNEEVLNIKIPQFIEISKKFQFFDLQILKILSSTPLIYYDQVLDREDEELIKSQQQQHNEMIYIKSQKQFQENDNEDNDVEHDEEEQMKNDQELQISKINLEKAKNSPIGEFQLKNFQKKQYQEKEVQKLKEKEEEIYQQKQKQIQEEKEKELKKQKLKKEKQDKIKELTIQLQTLNQQEKSEKNKLNDLKQQENDIQQKVNKLQDEYYKKLEEEKKKNQKLQKKQNDKNFDVSTLEISRINLNNMERFIFTSYKRQLNNWIINIDELTFKNVIASGSTCKVFRGLYKNNQVAIKKFTTGKSEEQTKFIKEFLREVTLLIQIPAHQNLLSLLGFSISDDEVCLVSEYCEGGTLFDILYKKFYSFKLTVPQKFKILIDIAKGMQFLHQLKLNFIHRDMKSLNILIDKRIEKKKLNFQAKVVDFGLVKSTESLDQFATQFMGTYHWMAPEIFDAKNKNPYSTKSDVYAFSIVMWEVFAQLTPYYELGDPKKVAPYVYKQDGRPQINDIKVELDQEIKDLIVQNWDREPNNRMEFDDIVRILEKEYQKLINEEQAFETN